jgi:hypothetical protein
MKAFEEMWPFAEVDKCSASGTTSSLTTSSFVMVKGNLSHLVPWEKLVAGAEN